VLSECIAYYSRARADRLACVDLRSGLRLSFAALNHRCDVLAATFVRLVGNSALRGARIAVLARNSSDLVAAHVACRRTGAIFVPLNWRLSARELAALVRVAEPSLVLFDGEFSSVVSALSDAAPRAIWLELGAGGAFEREIQRAGERAESTQPAGEDDVITLLFTSGTTGRPKGVMVTERNARISGLNYALSVGLDARSVMLCDMPLFHVVGLLAATCATLQSGGTLLISPQFGAESTYARLADPALAVTNYFCVPQMLRTLRSVPGFDHRSLQHLQALQTGGAPHPASAVREWLDEGVLVVDGYGMTEIGTALGMPPGDLALLSRKAGSIGVPAPFIEIKLVDRDGREVGTDEVGEVWLRGPSMTPGYWRDDDATRAAFQDGWLRTADAGRRDADGFYTLVDRWKDMYISGGENVYPTEVEAVLLELEGVAEAAVIGVPDPKWGEVGAAFLVFAGGVRPPDEKVIAHCRERLAGYKVPKHLREVSSLQRTASGKLQKEPLRSSWRSE
jgi:fatty-acyl-CoA synthase